MKKYNVLLTLLIALLPVPLPSSATSPLTVMPLGDSITAGWNPTTQEIGPGYRGPLCSLLGGAVTFVGSQIGGPALPCTNNEEGHPGWEIPRLTGQVDGWIAAAHPQIILLMAGTNDIDRLPGDPLLASDSTDLDTLVTHIISDTPSSLLLVASIPPTGNPDWTTEAISYNATIPGIVSAHAALGAHIGYVDVFSTLTPADLADDLHPSEEGYAKVAQVWATALASVVPSAPPVATSTVTPSASPTLSPTTTPSKTASPTPTDTPTATASGTPTPTETDTASATPSPTPTQTGVPTPTETRQPTSSATAASTPSPTQTPLPPTAQPTETDTPRPTETALRTAPVATATPTPHKTIPAGLCGGRWQPLAGS